MWSHVSNHAELMSNDVNKLLISTFIHKTIEKLTSFSLSLSKHNANQWRMKLDWYFVLRHDVMTELLYFADKYFVFYLCWPVIYSVLQSGQSIVHLPSLETEALGHSDNWFVPIPQGGTRIFGRTGMCRSNGSFFNEKSLNMGPVFYQKILKHGSTFLTEPKFSGLRMAKTPKITKFLKNGPIFQKILKNGYPFLPKSPLKMGRGFEARAAHPCPTQILVPPPPGPIHTGSVAIIWFGQGCDAANALKLLPIIGVTLADTGIYF